jgi:hypothetical protein
VGFGQRTVRVSGSIFFSAIYDGCKARPLFTGHPRWDIESPSRNEPGGSTKISLLRAAMSERQALTS